MFLVECVNTHIAIVKVVVCKREAPDRMLEIRRRRRRAQRGCEQMERIRIRQSCQKRSVFFQRELGKEQRSVEDGRLGVEEEQAVVDPM